MPFDNLAQSAACYAKRRAGETGWDCDEWAKKTDFSKLKAKQPIKQGSITMPVAAPASPRIPLAPTGSSLRPASAAPAVSGPSLGSPMSEALPKTATLAEMVNAYLDKVAAHLPMTKQACIRRLQLELCLGHSIPQAIKIAYANSSEQFVQEQAYRLTKQAMESCKVQGPQTYHGDAKGGVSFMKKKV